MSRQFALLIVSYAGALVCFVLAGAIVYSAYRRIREGSFDLYGSAVERKKNPGSFWAVVAIALLGACWLAYVGMWQIPA